jgi:subtilisin family serine protease
LLAVTLVLMARLAPAATDFVYVWYPRNADLAPESPPYKVLRALLRLIPSKPYTVAAGDNPDFILRKLFLISAMTPRAYTLYQERLYELNPALKTKANLKPGDTLTVPGGPTYGGTKLTDLEVPTDVFDSVFQRMSAKAYFGPARSPSMEIVKPKAVRSLRHFVAPDKQSLLSTTAESAFSEIMSAGIIAPIDRVVHPEEILSQAQAYPVSVPDDGSEGPAFNDLQSNEKDGNLLPALVRADQSAEVPCQNCTKCLTLLNLPVGQSVSSTKILVADTGIDVGMLSDSTHILLPGADGDSTDISPEHHGTFVYRQLAMSGFGPFSDSSIYVAKVARFDSTGLVAFSMEDIIKAQQLFGNKMRSSANGPQTWVVNLSAAGEPPVGTIPPPSPPFDRNILLIAAAGNSKSNVIPLNEAFGRLTNGNTPLLVVGALDVNGQRTGYSNYHPVNVQLFARGDCVCGSPGQLNGTSQAAPVVAAAASMLAANRPKWYPREVMWRLLSTGDNAGESPSPSFGGVLNLSRALQKGSLITTAANATPINAQTIAFNADFAQAILKLEQDDPRYPILRLARISDQPGQACFSTLRYQRFDRPTLCTSSGATVTITSPGGTQNTIMASTIIDIVLPLPSERTTGTPNISVDLQ